MSIAAGTMQNRIDSTIADLDSGFTYVVGVAIFRPSSEPVLQVLIVKRAEHETSYANYWELPGGRVESNETIGEAVRREAYEETGLTIDRILGEIDELRWGAKSGRQRNIQCNYVATVKEEHMEISLNPDEHSDWAWATEEDVEKLQMMTPGMKKVLKDAFEFARKDMTPFLSHNENMS